MLRFIKSGLASAAEKQQGVSILFENHYFNISFYLRNDCVTKHCVLKLHKLRLKSFYCLFLPLRNVWG